MAAIAIAGLTGNDSPSETPPPDSQVGGEEISVKAAAAFDPVGGDGEHDEELSAATDGNPSNTAWSTETYDTADFSGIKDGVGIVLDAGEPASPTELNVTTLAPGWTAEVYGSDASTPPAQLNKWTELAPAIEIDKDEQSIQLNATQPNQYFLLWITSLAPAPDDDGGFRVEISDLELTG